jgi:hypothetical protein
MAGKIEYSNTNTQIHTRTHTYTHTHTHTHSHTRTHTHTHTQMIVERPQPGTPAADSWSETGDRYLLKLFLDYVFHQTEEEEQPVIDFGSVVQCLNKLDVGVSEKVCVYVYIYACRHTHKHTLPPSIPPSSSPSQCFLPRCASVFI